MSHENPIKSTLKKIQEDIKKLKFELKKKIKTADLLTAALREMEGHKNLTDSPTQCELSIHETDDI